MDLMVGIAGILSFLALFFLAVDYVSGERAEVQAWQRTVEQMGATYRQRAKLLRM
jgi:hypothetical protein